MEEIIGVTFVKDGRINYYYTNGFKLKKGINVLVECNKGVRLGKIATEPHMIDTTKLDKPLSKIKKIASKKDYCKNIENMKEAKLALKKCRSLVKKYKLIELILEYLLKNWRPFIKLELN